MKPRLARHYARHNTQHVCHKFRLVSNHAAKQINVAGEPFKNMWPNAQRNVYTK